MKSKLQKIDFIEIFHYIPPYITPSPTPRQNPPKGQKRAKIPFLGVLNIYVVLIGFIERLLIVSQCQSNHSLNMCGYQRLDMSER
jgi:hypothetical protein